MTGCGSGISSIVLVTNPIGSASGALHSLHWSASAIIVLSGLEVILVEP